MAETTGDFLNMMQDDKIYNVITKEDIMIQLQHLGIQRGMLLLLEVDSSDMGYICGGMQTFLEAVMECVGYEGTIVMPTFTPDNLDPASHDANHISRDNWEVVRKHAQPFNRKLSPPHTKEAMVHQFLRNEGVIRSYHPIYSFAAWGKYAKIICDKHPLHFGLSKESPLGKLFELNGYVLLAGCSYVNCQAFHFARYSGEQLPIRILSAPLEHNNRTIWKEMLDLHLNTDGFDAIGEVMEERKIVKASYINAARCRFFSMREAIHIATAYFHIK